MALTMENINKINSIINADFESVPQRPLSTLEVEKPIMWFQYSAPHFPEAIDMHSAIDRLGHELSCIAFDRLHAMNYDMNYCCSQDDVERLDMEYKMYKDGAARCMT
ncbi:hypothetical protein NQ315_009061 [Exocentrus adspersus]|uniref:Uncharacterized protein n=1 Tax=Exocentrus adspersus TaxID=1586481 RepID=A0AAV8V5M4_9CUCU|nr:hypothetical protein NQ315_009061 [Exocentrus adspersus]